MKNQSLSVFCTLLLLFNLLNFSLSSNSDSLIQSKAFSEMTDAPYQGGFYVQRFYPGRDPIDNIRQSEFSPVYRFFEVNNDWIYFSRTIANLKEDFEDSISLSQLYDPASDSIAEGICCSRITYHQFPQEKGLKTLLVATVTSTPKGDPVVKKSKPCEGTCKPSPITAVSKPAKQMKTSAARVPLRWLANYCLTLYVPDEARWRICHSSQDEISKLHMKLLFHIVNTQQKKGKSVPIPSLLANAYVGREAPVKKWDWQTQNKWGGSCRGDNMQSPINIIPAKTLKGNFNFNISYGLLPVNTLIKRNQEDVIVAFTNFGGVVKLAIDNTYILYTPTYMSFRFPSEHLIDGNRFLGEILIHFEEFSKQQKSSTTHGLIINIPFNPSEKENNFDPLESLNLDFWKYEIEKKGVYIPKKFMKKKLLAFDISALMAKINAMKPNYQFYFGSHTTPPCKEQTYHLVSDKPLLISPCQFKLLRQNSLMSDKAVLIHSRAEQSNNDRPTYTFSSANIKRDPDVIKTAPQVFNKYLVKHGYRYAVGYKNIERAEEEEEEEEEKLRKEEQEMKNKVLTPEEAKKAKIIAARRKLLAKKRLARAIINRAIASTKSCDLSKEVKSLNKGKK